MQNKNVLTLVLVLIVGLLIGFLIKGSNVNGGDLGASAGAAKLAPKLASLTLNPTSVVGGNSATGTVTLTAPSISSGSGGMITCTQVTLSSSDSSIAQVPTTVTVPCGSMTANFTITTYPVTAVTPVTITASYGGVVKTAILPLTPPSTNIQMCTEWVRSCDSKNAQGECTSWSENRMCCEVDRNTMQIVANSCSGQSRAVN